MERLKLILHKSKIAYIVSNLNGEIQFISSNFFEAMSWDIAAPPLLISDLKNHVHGAYKDAFESVVEIGKLGLEESVSDIKYKIYRQLCHLSALFRIQIVELSPYLIQPIMFQ